MSQQYPGTPPTAPPYGSQPYGAPQYGNTPYGAPQYGNPAYGPVGYAPAPPMNNLALIGFILALVSVPVAPIILGMKARRQIAAGNGSGDGFALAAIIIGWIGVAGWAFALIVTIVTFLLTGSLLSVIFGILGQTS